MNADTSSGMKTAATILAFVVGGIIAGAIGCVAAFYGLFGVLRLLCWLAGSDDYMFFMWFAMLIAPLVGLSLFVSGGSFVALCTAERLKSGYDEVVTTAGSDDAG